MDAGMSTSTQSYAGIQYLWKSWVNSYSNKYIYAFDVPKPELADK